MYSIPTEIPPVENLMAVDKCTNVTASWNITERHCEGLSYNVILMSSDSVTLGPFITNDTNYTFTGVETLNGDLSVNVFGFNRDILGSSLTVPVTTTVSPEG